jgi:signal transduction histidine kinase
VDIANRTRKLVLQNAQTIEQQRIFRLGFARVIYAILLLGVAYAVNTFLDYRPAPGAANPNLVYIIGAGYLLYSFIVLGAAATFAKRATWLTAVSLSGDVLLATAIAWFTGMPVFAAAYLPSILLTVFTGPIAGIIGTAVTGVANLAFLFLGSPARSLTSEIGLISLIVFGVALLVGVFAFLVMQSRAPLTQAGSSWLEDALDRANSENLQELLSRVKAMYRVASTLNATLDYQKVVKNILAEVKEVFDVSIGAVFLFEGTMNNLRIADEMGLTDQEKMKAIDSRYGVIRDALSEARPILVEDPDTMEELFKILPSLRTCSKAIIMPLRGGYEVYGLLLIASTSDASYHESDLEMMVALTAHTVVAMQNATLYHNLLEDRNKMINAEEEVRHTLARNLHDGPAQAVAAFSMQTEFIRRLLKSDPTRAEKELQDLGKQAQMTSKEIRTLLYELRPLVLESQGLNAALEQYASRFPMNPSDPHVHFSANEDLSNRVSPAVETTIFTIMQEAVNNARKHAAARNIWLSITFQNGYVIATAQDDGRGFDVEAVKRTYDQRGSLGLTNMNERAALVGGTAEIMSRPGKGTTVVIRIPLTESNLNQPTMSGARSF